MGLLTEYAGSVPSRIQSFMCETAHRFKPKTHITTHRDKTDRSFSSISHNAIFIVVVLFLFYCIFGMEDTAERMRMVRKIVTRMLTGRNRKFYFIWTDEGLICS